MLLTRSRQLELVRRSTWDDIFFAEILRVTPAFVAGNFVDANLGAMSAAGLGVVDGPGAIKTMVFAVDVEALSFTTVSGTMVGAWQTGDSASGSGGCLKWTTATNGDNERRADLQPLTWVDYGVPANATVVSITLASIAFRQPLKTGQTASKFDIAIQDGVGTNVYAGGQDLYDSVTDVPPSSAVWTRVDQQRTFAVTSGNQPATSTANILITYESVSAGGTNVDFRVDDIAFVVAYTLPDRQGISPDIVLGAVTSSATAAVAIAAVESQTLGGVAITAAGTVAGGGGISGDVTQTLGAVTDAATATVAITAADSSTLGAVTAAATAAVAVAGVDSSTLGALTSTETGAVAIAATSSPTLGALTDTATTAVAITAAEVSALGAVTSSAAAAVAIAAATSPTLGVVTDVAAGAVAIAASASDTLGGIGLSAQGGSTGASGDLAATLGAITDVATATVAIAAAATPTLGALADLATTAVAVAGAASPSLGAIGETATASVEIGGTSADTLGTVTVSAQAIADTRGVVDVTLGLLTSVGGASSEDDGVAAVTLGAVTLTAAGHGPPKLVGELDQVLELGGVVSSLVLTGSLSSLVLGGFLTAIDP